jgi:hypothetical protein
MEPQKPEKSVQSPCEGQTAPPRQPERKRRFQIVKLEERIAPSGTRHKSMSPQHACGSGGRTC